MITNYKQIRTLEELEIVINSAIEEAMNEACEIAINKLVEFVNNDFYKVDRSYWYERGYEFADPTNWEAKIDRRYNNLTMNIHYKDGLDSPFDTIGKPLNYGQMLSIMNDPLENMDMSCNLSAWGSFPKGHFWDEFEDWIEKEFPIILREKINELTL